MQLVKKTANSHQHLISWITQQTRIHKQRGYSLTVGFPSPPKALLPTAVRPLKEAGRLKGSAKPTQTAEAPWLVGHDDKTSARYPTALHLHKSSVCAQQCSVIILPRHSSDCKEVGQKKNHIFFFSNDRMHGIILLEKLPFENKTRC